MIAKMFIQKDLLSFITAATTVVYLYFGLYVLLLDRKSRIHRIFFYMTLSLAYWSFCAFWAYSSHYVYSVEKWVKISFVAPSLFYALVLHFALKIYKPERPLPIIIPLIYLPAFYFIFMNYNSYVLYESFSNSGDIWIFELGSDLMRTYSFIIYASSYLIISNILIFLKYFNEKSYRKKMQARILAITLFLSFMIALFENIIIPEISSYRSSQLTMVIFLIWIFGIWYAMAKYRFLKISPAVVSRDMINNILEAVVLLDGESNIISINNRVEAIVGKSSDALIHQSVSEIIEEDQMVMKEIKRMEDGGYSSFSGRIHFKTNGETPVLMDARFSIVNDNYGDKIGFMIIGAEVKELKQLKALYKITPREAQIIQLILSGKSNREIAVELNVSERTIKAHVSHIFSKFGVENRVNLLKKLRDFNLIPNQKADKTLLLLKNRKNMDS